MQRREFITHVGGATIALAVTTAIWPLATAAQQTNRTQRVGFLLGGFADDPVEQRYIAAFREALAKLGWIDGGNLRVDLGFATGDPGRAVAAAAELARFAPDVMVASSGFAARASQQQTRTIPIVVVGPSPEDFGVKDIARPEGNITGFPLLYQSIAGKWVELLKEADPHVVRVAVVNSPDPLAAARQGYIPPIEQAAPTIGIKLVDAAFHNAADLERAVDAFASEPNGGLIAIPSAATSTRENRNLIRQLAEKHRLPTIHWDDSYPAGGGLMSYGSNFTELHRRAAAYVDRLLRGAKVSELPIERPTKFELVINVKAAKTIGLAIPEAFLLRADRLID